VGTQYGRYDDGKSPGMRSGKYVNARGEVISQGRDDDVTMHSKDLDAEAVDIHLDHHNEVSLIDKSPSKCDSAPGLSKKSDTSQPGAGPADASRPSAGGRVSYF